ncbi:Sarcosine oxidase, gamma subunit family [compost metagenome]
MFVPLAKEYEYLDALNEAFAGTFTSAALMSDSRFALEITGPSAQAFLSKGTGLSTDSADFPPNSATTTRFIGMPALLVHRDLGSYRLYFDVSYASYVSAWVLDASEEFLTQSA